MFFKFKVFLEIGSLNILIKEIFPILLAPLKPYIKIGQLHVETMFANNED